jgi:hypothetical protein
MTHKSRGPIALIQGRNKKKKKKISKNKGSIAKC